MRTLVRRRNGRGSSIATRWCPGRPCAASPAGRPEIAGHRRCGGTTIWLILAGPAVLGVLILVTDLAHLWLARVELEDALGATALAAVKEWGDQNGGDTLCPRDVGVTYAEANTVTGQPVTITNNYDPSEINDNASCDGNLIFGAILPSAAPFEPPFTFNAGIEPFCGCPGTVFIDVQKETSGASQESDTATRMLGIFFDESFGNFAIQSVSFTMPEVAGVPDAQQPHWDGSNSAAKRPVVSIFNTQDSLNRFNPTPEPFDVFPGLTTRDVRGIDPDPVVPTLSTPQESIWNCLEVPDPDDCDPDTLDDPDNLDPGFNTSNPNGDVCFTFSDEVPTNSPNDAPFRTLTIHFRDGSFTSTNDPNTTDFLRFGAAVSQLNPPAIATGAGNNNDGDAFGIAGVQITVTFVNLDTCETVTCTGAFVDDEINNDRSEANLTGGANVRPFAVRAQATHQVKSLWERLCGIPLGPYNVTAKETAFYDCVDQCPRLIHVEEFICPGP